MEKFRFLSKEEIAGFDLENDADLTKARALESERFEENQRELAKRFVDEAENLEADVNARVKSDYAQLQRYFKATNGNLIAGLDMFLYNRPDYRAHLNRALKEKGNDGAQIRYGVTAARAGKRAFSNYMEAEKPYTRALMTTVDDPGVANTVDVTVAQSILFRAENVGNVLPRIAKINLPFGDYEEPYYNKYGQAGYLTETGTVPDFNTYLSDATDGINKTKWTPRDFALGLKQSFRTLQKLSPSILNQIFEFIAIAMTSGMEYQAISGPGTGTTDSGMLLNATSITAGATDYDTFVDACSEIASKNVVNKVGFANAKAIGAFKKLRVVDRAYRDSIVPSEEGLVIDGISVIEVPETIMATVTGVAEVVVGDPEHYLVVTSGSLNEYKDDSPESLQRFTAFHTLRDGGVRFADSFAKFSVNV